MIQPPNGFIIDEEMGAGSPPPPPGFQIDEPPQKQPNAIQRAIGAADRFTSPLTIPEKMSRQGLGQMAGMVPKPEPTGNLPMDIVRGAPRVMADTVAEVAPDFVSRGSMLTSGALRIARPVAKILKPLGRGVGKMGEAISGLEYKTPGVLREAFNDRRLITGQGTGEAGTLFDDLMAKGRIRQSFGRLKNEPLIDEALKALDEGNLTPEEALVARRALDKARKSFPEYSYRKMREGFDSVAKTKSAEADAAYSRAVKSDALRQPLPVNKSGGTSIAKGILGTISSVGTLGAMSPFVQGIAATGAGVGYRTAGRLLKPLAKNAVRSGAAIAGGSATGKRLLKPREEKILTDDEAKNYLKKARGDRSAARRLATADGWTIPE